MVMETFKWMEMKTTDYDVHLFEQTQSDFIIWLKYKKICYTFLLHGTILNRAAPYCLFLESSTSAVHSSFPRGAPIASHGLRGHLCGHTLEPGCVHA